MAKELSKAQPTAFHQDQMKWPFERPRHTLSAWTASQDAPVKHGCMSFLAGSHKAEGLPNIGTDDQERWKQEKSDLQLVLHSAFHTPLQNAISHPKTFSPPPNW